MTLIPASARPYIGGSQHNSVWELILGYNGLGRLTGNETGSVGGGGGGSGHRHVGLDRPDPAVRRRHRRPDRLAAAGRADAARRPACGSPGGRRAPTAPRALLIVWGGWLLVTGLTFSEIKGIFHQYYTVALAPAIAAVVGVGAASLWRRRRPAGRAPALAGTVAVTAIWSFVLLDRSTDWHPWLRYAVLVGRRRQRRDAPVVSQLTRRVAAGVVGARWSPAWPAPRRTRSRQPGRRTAARS